MGVQDHRRRAREFLRVARRFRLGHLPTERPHPRTRQLSTWAREDLPRAVAVLKAVDLEALGRLERYAARIDRVARRVRRTLARGRRVFLCGCGATGRLSLSLEFLWRERFRHDDRVLSFMAGGDVALIHALEGFEDFPDYGARHLVQAGFEDGDLLIACTEGGETPYVIGATEKAAEMSSNPPCFLYCNSDAVLARHLERFRRVRDNGSIEKICLYVGPMALTGSTRMQASTVLQLAVGAALLHPEEPARDVVSRYRRQVAEVDLAFLPRFIEREAAIYAAGQYVNYVVRDYGITVFTDATERAPTFSLVPFDQLVEPRARHSLCYISLDGARTAGQAWLQLLNRSPRPLDWPDVDPRTTAGYLQAFDFSVNALEKRRRRIRDGAHHVFRIRATADGAIELRVNGACHALDVAGMPALARHLLLKQVLNIHSTLVMGRLGRYTGNLMTWVAPTNGKLVDRATRYVGHLLADAGRGDWPYDEIVRQVFAEMDRIEPGESVVLKAYRSLLRRNGHGRSALPRVSRGRRRMSVDGPRSGSARDRAPGLVQP